uniref:Uncharacterized protein n=2 Tax=Anas TaxID=8835 RepID=A0A8B9UXP6_9AVES
KMFPPQRSLQMVTFLAMIFFACFATSQDTEKAVTEHQLMHDKGRAFQGLKRLMWLYNALGSVHTNSLIFHVFLQGANFCQATEVANPTIPSLSTRYSPSSAGERDKNQLPDSIFEPLI